MQQQITELSIKNSFIRPTSFICFIEGIGFMSTSNIDRRRLLIFMRQIVKIYYPVLAEIWSAKEGKNIIQGQIN